MQKKVLPSLLLLVVICHLSTTLHVEKCNLQPSELGPDWYKVTRPIPTGLENDPDYQNSFVHMPCAATTVFDIGVCACTNMMSYMYSYMSGQKAHHGHHREKLQHKPFDLVRTIDPVKPKSAQDTPVGTRLLNIRTGEVHHCPFRASSRGSEWYLVHEHTSSWRHMRCAPGTLFQKRSCTCVHGDLLSKQSENPEDNDIVVLEEEYGNHNQDNTISKSLGISVSDVDFSKKSIDEPVPFWRRRTDQQLNKPGEEPSTDSVAVFVSPNGEVTNFDSSNRFPGFDMGNDKIADKHRMLLNRLRKGPISNFGMHRVNSAMALDLDSKKEEANKSPSVRHKEMQFSQESKTFITPDIAMTTDKKPIGVKLDNQKSERIDELNKAIEFLGKNNLKSANVISKLNGIDMKNDQKDLSRFLPVNDEIYFADRECPKKPLPELGPQYFRFYLWGVGYVSYTCHGNLIYDDKVCACIPAPESSTINEINIPAQDCNKKALPEDGPEYFKMFMWDVGFVRYACYGGKIFDQKRCECVTNVLKEK